MRNVGLSLGSMSQQVFVTFKNTIQSDAKSACSVVYLEKSFETVLVNVEEGEDVKVVLVHKQWVLTSQGPFILLPCLVVFPENCVSFVPTRKSVMKYTHSNSAFSFSLYSMFLTLE